MPAPEKSARSTTPPVAIPSTFGQLLKAARLSLGLTQVVAAEKCGLKAQHWSDMENDRRKPYWETVVGISRGLGVSTEMFCPAEEPATEGSKKS